MTNANNDDDNPAVYLPRVGKTGIGTQVKKALSEVVGDDDDNDDDNGDDDDDGGGDDDDDEADDRGVVQRAGCYSRPLSDYTTGNHLRPHQTVNMPKNKLEQH